MGHLTRAVSRDLFPVAKNGFAPFGLNNSLYFGHTFWDMDVWVLPSMLFLQPDAVRQMNQYRLDRARQAEKNAAEFFKKPNTGMMFPWESSVSGKETVRASSVKEHHVSGSVLWGLNLSEKAGVASTTEVAKVANGVSRFFQARSVAGPDGREIKDVMSPDENHIGDNDLYTNLLAQWAMNGRKWDGPEKFKLPKDGKSFLTYDEDKERSYKQAAAILSIFPLQYPAAEKQARVMMDRFESKVSKNGPAMTDAIHATIWARLGEKEKAYDAWKRAWEPFVKGPQMMFSEKRSSERTYFYTGAAGCLNTVLYGFAGFRFDEKPLNGASWKKQLKSGWWLSCKPSLPPKWTSLRINPMIIDGIKYSVEIEGATARIEPLLEY
jgi:trehalose/maltose hydrolase-like predicted phosphorylase